MIIFAKLPNEASPKPKDDELKKILFRKQMSLNYNCIMHIPKKKS